VEVAMKVSSDADGVNAGAEYVNDSDGSAVVVHSVDVGNVKFYPKGGGVHISFPKAKFLSVFSLRPVVESDAALP
jgi:hypothetical protein